MRLRRALAALFTAGFVPLLFSTNAFAKDSGPETPGEVSHDETGFKFETKDKKFEMRMFGIVQADFRDYLDRHDRTDYDKFLVRRARPYIEGHTWGGVDYRLMLDFGRGRADLLDAFVDAHIIGNFLRFRAGKYKQPLSYEQFKMEDLTLAPFERSILDNLAQARNIGAMVYGEKLFGKRLDWYFGAVNGLRDSDFEEKRHEKDLVGRVAVRPFQGDTGDLKYLQFGISAAWGNESDTVDPDGFQTPLRVPFFKFEEGVVANGTRFRIMPEFAAFAGPFAVATQWGAQRQDVRNSKVAGAPNVQVPIQTFYVMGSWIITGEHRHTWAEFVKPKHPLDLAEKTGSGAFELILRTSGMKVGDVAFLEQNHIANVAASTTVANEVTVGLNWYLNRWVWFMADYEHDWFKQQIKLGTGDTAYLTTQDAIGLRSTVMW